MNTILAKAIAGKLNVTEAEVQKWDTDDASALTAEAVVKPLRVFKQAELDAALESHLTEKKPDIEREARKVTHQTLERKIMEKHGIKDYKFGEHYTDTEDLIGKIITIKAKPSGDPTADQKRITELENDVVELRKSKTADIETATTAGQKKYFNSIISGELARIEDRLDIEDEKKTGYLRFLKNEFDNAFTLREEADGSIVVLNKEGKVQKDDLMKPLKLASVVIAIAESFTKLKDGSGVGGRGSDPADPAKKGAPGKVDWSAFATWEDFLKSSHGKGLVPGSKVSNEHFAEFMKAKGDA